MKSTNKLLAVLWLLCVAGSARANDDARFTQALAEASRLTDTPEGKAYDDEFGKAVAPQMSGIIGQCTKGLGPKVKFEIVFIFDAEGRVQDVLTASDQPAAKCLGEKLRNLQLPAPPHAGWPVQFGVDIDPNNGPMLLSSALKLMAKATWEVDATLNRGVKMRIHGLVSGEDFDLTLEPGGRNPVRQIGIKDKIWASFDGGKTWKLQTIAEQVPFRRIYNFVHNPIRPDAAFPAMAIVEKQTRDGEGWIHLRSKSEARKQNEAQRLEYWFAISSDPKRNGVRRYEGPITEPGHEKEPLHCVATYQPANDKTIQPPDDMKTSSNIGSSDSVALAPSEKSTNGVNLLDGKLKIDVPITQ
jgi:hypothetical protein